MRGGEFKARALHEGLRYGEDKMVFTREFAQNARDAGATHVTVETRYIDQSFAFVFQDNGSGLALEDAKQYLFRLYSSSKEQESQSAGRFGVGFWSVLLISPQIIEISSRTIGEKAWKVTIDGALNSPVLEKGTLEKPGFRVMIRRAVSDEMEFHRLNQKARKSLSKYGRFLRQNDPQSSPLPIHFNGDPINEPFMLAGPCATTYKSGPREGAIGLGSRPRVELYAKGLLVWRGTVLDELRYGAPLVRTPKFAEGLAPVFLLGAGNLNVTLDRRAVIDDSALSKVRFEAKRRMRKLLLDVVDTVSQRTLLQRLGDWLFGTVEDIRAGDYNRVFGPIGAVLAVALAVVLALCFIDSEGLPWTDPNLPIRNLPLTIARITPSNSESSKTTPLGNSALFFGPSVNPFGKKENASLFYQPPASRLFRVAALEKLDPGLGIIGKELGEARVEKNATCQKNCIAVKLEINTNAGTFVLPCTTGGLVVPSSVRLNRTTRPGLYRTLTNESFIRFSKGGKGHLEYQIAENVETLTAQRRKHLLHIPRDMGIPKRLARAIQTARGNRGIETRVKSIQEFVKRTIAYDDSPQTFLAYDAFLNTSPTSGWLDFVLGQSKGDCDVKNTVAVVAIRKLGIAARLAVGFVGEKGRVRPGMHAWIEYYDGTWRTADATGSRAQPASQPGQAPSRFDQAPTTESSPTNSSSRKISAPRTKTDRQKGGPIQWTKVIGASAILFILVTGIVVIFFLTRREPRDEREMEQQRLLLASLASRGGSDFGSLLAIQRSPVFPVLGSKRRMSQREAVDRAWIGRLWCSEGKSDLAKKAVANGARILDTSAKEFAKLIRCLPGVQDLDRISELQQVAPSALVGEFEEVGRTLTLVNGILARTGLIYASVLPCLGLTDRDVLDVDLSGLRMRRGPEKAQQFVAIRPRAVTSLQKDSIRNGHDGLAAFEILAFVVKESERLRPFTKPILRLAAREALGEMG